VGRNTWGVVRGAFLVELIGCDEARLTVNAVRNSAISQFRITHHAPRIT
jgi:hypothetical protein